MENGEWRMENGEWRVESGEWKVESGKWEVRSGKWEGGARSRFADLHSNHQSPSTLGTSLVASSKLPLQTLFLCRFKDYRRSR